MIYLGHFSFDEHNEDGRFGHFSSMVEAKTPEAAEKAFKKLILDIRKQKTLFSTAPMDIFLDTFIEVGEIPKTGLVTWYSSFYGDVQGRISTALPHDDTGGCRAYDFYPEDRPDILEAMEANKEHEAIPFVSFEPTATQKKAALLKAEMERLSQPVVPQRRNPFSKKHW